MIMSAGLGKRLRPFTSDIPKALMPVMGVPVIQFAIDALKNSGINKTFINYHHLPERSVHGLTHLDFNGLDFELSDESDNLMGSGGGVKKVIPRLGENPFLLLNADCLFSLNPKTLMERHLLLKKTKDVKVTLAIGCLGSKDQAYQEMLLDKNTGLITGLGEFKEKSNYYLGWAIIEPEVFNNLSDQEPFGLVEQVFLPAINNNQAGFYFCENETWIDIGSPSLWWKAHMHMVHKRNELPNEWKKRIESTNVHLAENIWVNKEVKEQTTDLSWQAPCYWNGSKDYMPPNEMGPNAFYYGNEELLKSNNKLSDGIGMNEHWVSIKD